MMRPRYNLAALAAIALFGAIRAGAQSQTFELNHVHVTASIFMDTDEMHRVSLEVLSDSLRISAPYSFKSQDSSRTLQCSLPSSIRFEQIVGIETKVRRTFWSGGGSVYQLKIEAFDEQNKKHSYVFVSGTAVHKSKQEGGYWREGTDGGQSVQMASKALSDAIQTHKADERAARFEGRAHKSDGVSTYQPNGLDFDLGPQPQAMEQSGHTASVDALVVTPDKRWLISAGHDFSIRMWDLQLSTAGRVLGRQVRVLGRHLREVNVLAISRDGHWLVSGGNDKILKLWELPSGRFVRNLVGHGESVKAAVFTPDGHWVVSGSGDPPGFENRTPDFSIRIWDPTTGREVRRLAGHEKTVMSLDVSRDGKVLASSSLDGTVKVWDLHTGSLLRTLDGFGGMVEAASFSSDGSTIATVSMGRVELWDVSTGRELATVARDARPYHVVFNPTNLQIAYPSEGSVKLYDLKERRPVAELKSSEKMVESLAFSPDGKWLFSGYWDGAIRIWDAADHAQLAKLSGFASRIHSVAVSPDGVWIASGGQAPFVGAWNTRSGRLEHKLKSENDEVCALAFASNGRWLASAGERHTTTVEASVEVWDFANEKSVFRFGSGSRKVEFLAFSPRGRWLAASTIDGQTRLWDLTEHAEPLTLSPANKVVAFASDDTWVATGSRDNALSYWQLPGGRPLQKLPGIAWAYAISPNGRWLASTGFLKDFRVWDIHAVTEWSKRHGNDRGVLFAWDPTIGRQQRTFRGHKEFVSDLAFSPDGQLIASCSWDGEIKLWNVESGRELRTLSGHASGVQAVAFTPGGRHLLSAGWDGTVRVWDVGTGAESAALISANESSDWVSIAPDGLFDGTADAMQQVGWRIGDSNEILSLGAFFTDFFHPGLLTQIMSGQHPKASIDMATALQVPSLRYLLTENLAHLEDHNGRIVVCFEQEPGVAMNVAPTDQRVRPPSVDGYGPGTTPTCKFEKSLSVNAKKGATLVSLTQQLQNWKPDVIATPWDHRSSDTTHSTLHVLTIGVSQYPPGSKFTTLPYAVPSAKAVEGFFREQQASPRKLYAQIRVWDGLYDLSATRGNIRQRLSEIAQESRSNDVVVVYLAGHGEVPKNEEMFYFVPVDGTDDDLPGTGLNTAILAEELRNLPPRRILLIVDACQSGGAIEALSKIATVKAQALLASTSPDTSAQVAGVGVHLIAATLPLSYAVGLSTGESVLAQTVIRGLEQGRAPVTAEDLSNYVKAHLPEVSEQATNGFRQVALISSIGLDFPLAIGTGTKVLTPPVSASPTIGSDRAGESLGTVNREMNGQPVSPAMGYLTIRADTPDTAIRIPKLGDESYGDWIDNPCPADTYVIIASRNGMRTEKRTVVLQPGQHITVNFSLSTGTDGADGQIDADAADIPEVIKDSGQPSHDTTGSMPTPQVLANTYLVSHDFAGLRAAASRALKEGGTVTIQLMHEHESVSGESVHPATLTLTRRTLAYDSGASQCRYSFLSVPLEKIETIEVTNRSVQGKIVGVVVRHLTQGTFLLHLDMRNTHGSNERLKLFFATPDSRIVPGNDHVNTLSSSEDSMQVLGAVANVIRDAKAEITWK